ncbi:MAG: hypothetical protein WA694_13815 [Pseudolabrys sp.]
MRRSISTVEIVGDADAERNFVKARALGEVVADMIDLLLASLCSTSSEASGGNFEIGPQATQSKPLATKSVERHRTRTPRQGSQSARTYVVSSESCIYNFNNFMWYQPFS